MGMALKKVRVVELHTGCLEFTDVGKAGQTVVELVQQGVEDGAQEGLEPSIRLVRFSIGNLIIYSSQPTLGETSKFPTVG